MDKSYSNCPLKKRPIHVIEEEDEPEEDDEMKPVDLSATSRINIYTKQNSSERHSWNSSDRSQLSPIREESFFMDRSGSSDDQTEYTNNPDWYSKPSLPQLQRLYAPIGNDRLYDQYTQQVSPARSDPMSPHTFRESSVSPPVILGSNTKQNQYQNTVFNYNNINMKSQTGYNTQQQPVFPYNMHSPVSDYSEPEDLSVKNKRKLLVLSDSNGNIQKSRKPKDHDTYYKCQHCVKCYSTYSGLVKHQESHAVPQDLSSHSAYNVMQANQQTRNYDDINVDQNSNSSDKRPSNLQRYQCRDCGKSYSTYSGLSKHQQFHCPAGESNQIKKFFSCKNCDKVYVSLGALKMHIRTHTLPCKCPLCGKAFSRPWLLQGHIRTHTGEKPFSCQHCHRAFADRSNLRAHLQTHSEVKKYSCSTCTKTFSRMSLLGKHLQAGCPGHISASSPTPSNDESGIKHETNYYLSNMNAINQQQQQHHYNNTNNNNNIHNHNNNNPTNNDRHLNYDQHLSMIQPSHEYHAPNEIPYRDNVQVY